MPIAAFNIIQRIPRFIPPPCVPGTSFPPMSWNNFVGDGVNKLSQFPPRFCGYCDVDIPLYQQSVPEE